MMMNYFKENPAALLDAIPTPREEEQETLADFKSGLTPKHNNGKLLFNDSMTIHRSSSKNLT
jgi:hypothetical protein